MKRFVVCLVVGVAALSTPAYAQSRNDPKTMMKLWLEATMECRGSAGANPPADADPCEEREAYSKRLNQLGWCYGKKNEAGYQYDWHRCTRDSLH
ncbi:hypothetical protein [Microvirga aerophila]|uniref:Uncharacterized protein n=1 Tax=Microvirga aerophila TaxID=670291 RepID=A0A512BNK8_9HYPH|nr:hypothetical protein [Microvirga aerophila]GEO13536.1 hypothetical protein MAE02_12320 [Microvirga aerophila]